ncbi:hypothetical protein HELRODRAFT_173192 [Helobdella robusta]|uniref:Uncharacterized protein n=1 Tax=Helobdella robusta TaxID=6412 RepID=T1F6J1_HELRO|nr:hypothetical protein HELRODRAFT_173192 [Helobdella robusta]ESO04105.1 hypothetical protein HELRODRAFT_173192 [Helobdella robusta]
MYTLMEIQMLRHQSLKICLTLLKKSRDDKIKLDETHSSTSFRLCVDEKYAEIVERSSSWPDYVQVMNWVFNNNSKSGRTRNADVNTTFSPRSGVAVWLPMMKPKYPSTPFHHKIGGERLRRGRNVLRAKVTGKETFNNEIEVKQVNSFNYLGGLITSGCKCDMNIKGRIAMGKDAYSKMKSILTNSKIRISTKLKLQTVNIPYLDLLISSLENQYSETESNSAQVSLALLHPFKLCKLTESSRLYFIDKLFLINQVYNLDNFETKALKNNEKPLLVKSHGLPLTRALLDVNTEILERESHPVRLKIKEALYIYKNKPAMNKQFNTFDHSLHLYSQYRHDSQQRAIHTNIIEPPMLRHFEYEPMPKEAILFNGEHVTTRHRTNVSVSLKICQPAPLPPFQKFSVGAYDRSHIIFHRPSINLTAFQHDAAIMRLGSLETDYFDVTSRGSKNV